MPLEVGAEGDRRPRPSARWCTGCWTRARSRCAGRCCRRWRRAAGLAGAAGARRRPGPGPSSSLRLWWIETPGRRAGRWRGEALAVQRGAGRARPGRGRAGRAAGRRGRFAGVGAAPRRPSSPVRQAAMCGRFGGGPCSPSGRRRGGGAGRGARRRSRAEHGQERASARRSRDHGEGGARHRVAVAIRIENGHETSLQLGAARHGERGRVSGFGGEGRRRSRADRAA